MRKRKRNRERKNIESKEEKKLSDIDSRRDARLGTILGIVVILATFCTILFRCTKSVMSVWPESGYVYYVLIWSTFIIPLSATLIICIDIIIYVVVDLNRYNIQNEQYRSFDKKSDQKYSLMINDFKIMLGVILAELIIFLYVNSFLQNSMKGILCMIVLGLSFIMGILILRKKIKKKEINRTQIWCVSKRIFVLVIMALVLLLIVLTVVINQDAKVDISYDKDGDVIIENAIDEDFGTASLCIYSNDGSLIKKSDILSDDVLCAKESRRQSVQNENGKEIGIAQEISGEMVYWKYKYRINELGLLDGTYYVVIDILQESKSVQITNMFEVVDGDFVFCKNNICKEY